MKVLIATYLVSSSPSGVVTYYQKLANDLTEVGIDIQLVDSSQTPAFWRKFLGILKRIMQPLGGTFQMAYDEIAYFTGVYLATRKLRQSNFDLIHAQDARSGVAAWMALGKRVPVVLSCHFNDDPVTEIALVFALKPWAIRRLTTWYRYLLSKIENYVFSSEYAYRLSKHLLPTRINKFILYNSVSPEVATAQSTRVPSNFFRISNVGYIDERKNQKLLIQAAHELCKRGIADFTIWFAGDCPKRAEYEQLATSLGVADKVHFHGQYQNPWKLVAQSDLYVHTALNDNCPFAVIEAFTVQTPVLALPVGGVPEMLPPNMGLLPDTELNTLTNEIIRSLDAKRRDQLTKAQTIFANRRFNHRTNLEELLNFYRETIRRSSLNVAYAMS